MYSSTATNAAAEMVYIAFFYARLLLMNSSTPEPLRSPLFWPVSRGPTRLPLRVLSSGPICETSNAQGVRGIASNSKSELQRCSCWIGKDRAFNTEYFLMGVSSRATRTSLILPCFRPPNFARYIRCAWLVLCLWVALTSGLERPWARDMQRIHWAVYKH